MIILFSTTDLEEICSKERVANKRLGKPCAKKLRRRLADIMAAQRVTDLVAGRPHPLVGDRAGQFALDLHGGARLVFEPAHEEDPLKDDGSMDWNRVTSIRVVFVGDYHD